MARLYADEHSPLKLTMALRALGHDRLTVQKAGNADQRVSDESVLAYMTEDKRAVIRMNYRHFIRLHQQLPNHSSIVVCTQNMDLSGQALRIHQTNIRMPTLAGQLVGV
jgi:hypothetical protein